MTDLDRYRAHAARCREIANTCVSPLDKEAWLKLAAGWLALAEQRAVWRQLPDDEPKAARAYTEAHAELVGQPPLPLMMDGPLGDAKGR